MVCTTRSICPMWPRPTRRRCAPSCASPFVQPEWDLLVSASPPSGGSFGALLRAGRHRANLSQQQLAARAELSERTVRNLEAGRVRSPRPGTVRLLADVLQLSGPERDSWVAAARASPRQSGPAGPVAGGTARASPGFVVGFIAVAPWGWPGPEPTDGSLGRQGEWCGREDVRACWAEVIRVLTTGNEHDIDQAGRTGGPCWVFGLGSRRTFADSGRAEGRGLSAGARQQVPLPRPGRQRAGR